MTGPTPSGSEAGPAVEQLADIGRLVIPGQPAPPAPPEAIDGLSSELPPCQSEPP